MPVEDISYTSPGTLRDLFARHGGAIRKRLGQNFLMDPGSIRRIAAVVRELGAGSKAWAEIGPGAGALTAELLKERNITALEIDPVAIKILEERFALELEAGRLQIMAGDAREILPQWTAGGMGCGNLPYYISTELLLLGLSAFQTCVFLFQLDFARRLLGEDSSLGIYVGNMAWRREHFRLSSAVFYPRPSVDSALVSLVKREAPLSPPNVLESILRASFLARRKKIGNSWKISGAATSQWFLKAADLGMDLNARAEEIPAERYYELAAAIEP